ncbi:MAG: hypothetical protein HOI59_00940 [Nitrospina sp.]|jgi:hypothetical protein|nr:hypothetical protein [Nitrospina sp.]MBT3416061.1 hypothetical protein [Nitrospina sp.]MBT3856431.1 hypothetical protein [Nitrospina sp.]MBT4103503.1 hypothetical protein [Nitrospina sp.]MBT4389468.1 hypothetical protein [Nitrospina sp.]
MKDPNSESQETESSSPEEEATQNNTETEFEEQEVLPPAEKKKSGAGKIFLFLVFVLAGSGGYLYFNNLIPAEILNLVFPQPSSSPALIATIPPTPLPEEAVVEPEVVAPEVIENSEPVAEEVEVVIPEPPAVPPVLSEAPHVSGSPAESFPAIRVSGNNSDQGSEAKEEEYLQDTAPIVPPVEELPEPPEPVEEPAPLAERNESVQAYLDFIESSVQKLGEWIREGFNLGWDYLKNQLG